MDFGNGRDQYRAYCEPLAPAQPLIHRPRFIRSARLAQEMVEDCRLTRNQMAAQINARLGSNRELFFALFSENRPVSADHVAQGLRHQLVQVHMPV
jgi:hypothetical protein